MPDIRPPSQIILENCQTLINCFQAFYNILFGILIVICFIWFLYGAALYLLSGALPDKANEGKKKMKDSIYALIIALILPVILRTIDPTIFSEQTLSIPVIKLNLKLEKENEFESILALERNYGKPIRIVCKENIGKTVRTRTGLLLYCSYKPVKITNAEGWKSCKGKDEWNFYKVFGQNGLRCIHPKNSEFVNPKTRDFLLELDRRLCEKNIHILITDAWSRGILRKCLIGDLPHQSPQHTVYGTAFDVVPLVRPPKPGERPANVPRVGLNDKRWVEVREIARQIGFSVLDEVHKGTAKSTGPHLHLEIYTEYGPVGPSPAKPR